MVLHFNRVFYFSIKGGWWELNLSMIPHNVVVVGSNAETPAKFFTQLDPVKLDENVGMAIRSILHGSIRNVTPQNNKIRFLVNVDESNPLDLVEDVLEIEEGNYSSTLAILKSISLEFSKAFKIRGNRRPRLIKPVRPPYLETNENEMDIAGNGYISFKPKNMYLIFSRDTPWSIFEKREFTLDEDETFRVKNINYSKTIQPTFLYSNIVENSYINGKLSRNLSTIPLSMNSGWNYHEFNNPVYVPIDVKQFSKIEIQLRDMNGEFIKFDPAFKTIINLHIKPINRSEPTL